MTSITQGTPVIIGIDTYRDGIQPLRSVANDARAMAEAFVKDHHCRTTHLLNDDASASAILEALGPRLADTLDEDTACLMYFSGHDVARGDEDAGQQGDLLPCDAAPADSPGLDARFTQIQVDPDLTVALVEVSDAVENGAGDKTSSAVFSDQIRVRRNRLTNAASLIWASRAKRLRSRSPDELGPART